MSTPGHTHSDRPNGYEEPSGATPSAKIGIPDSAGLRQLRRSGLWLAVADMLWIPQASLIAFALAEIVLTFVVRTPEPGNAAPVPAPIFAALAGIVLLAGVRAGIQYIAMNLSRTAAREVQSRARADLLQSVVLASPPVPLPASGAFSAHLTEQVDVLGPYYRNYVPQMVRLRIVPVAIVLAALPISWMAALILMVCGPIIPVFMALIGMRAKKASEAQQDELTRLSGMLLDRIRGLETLTLFGALQRTEADVAGAGERFRNGTMKVLSVAFLSSTVLELFSALGIAFVAVYVGFSLLGEIALGTWGGPLTYWGGLFILLLAPEFFAPLRGFAAAYHDRAAGLAALEKLEAIASNLPQSAASTGDVRAPADAVPSAPSLRFDDVSIGFGERPVFEDLTFDVPGGQTVLLYGASGSGKTSLIDSLLGFAAPCKGQILIDGDPLSGQAARVLRQQTMWLSQSPRLFHGSVKANLLMGHPYAANVQEDDIWEALDLAGVEDLIRGLPRGVATPIGEDGFGLSVGEIRRLCLARAALRRQAILLLADEPTAGLDDQTAQDVIAGLTRLSRGRTSVIATHSAAVLEMPGCRLDVAQLSRTFDGEVPA